MREELLLAAGHFFPLTDHEYRTLEASILQYGIRVEVLLGEHLALIDGRHRLLIAQQHRLEVPCRLLIGLTADQEREVAVSLNAARRQLTRAQKRSLVQAELMRNPARSDRLIAAICGVHWDTVGIIRAEIAKQQKQRPAAEHASQLDETAEDTTPFVRVDFMVAPTVNPPRRAGADGRHQTAPPPRKGRNEHLIGHANCAHGQPHAIYRLENTYRLQPE